MRKSVLTLFILLVTTGGFAQYHWDFGLKLGGSNYLGDMGGKEQTRRDFIMDMKLSQTRWALGGFARYAINNYVSVATTLQYARIQGSDALSTNKGRVGRNLSFRNDLLELNARGELYVYNLYDVGNRGRYQMDMKTFVFAGFGGVLSNPKARPAAGEPHQSLRKLQTEGKNYSLIQPVIPLGLGLLFTYKKQHRFGWEFGWRLTFTDYLDDISSIYVDPSETADPSLYYTFVNKTAQVEGMDDAWAANYVVGSKRGDPSHNDNYLFTQFTYSYVLRTRGSFYRTHYSWLGGRSKGFRRTRAKF